MRYRQTKKPAIAPSPTSKGNVIPRIVARGTADADLPEPGADFGLDVYVEVAVSEATEVVVVGTLVK